jgi:hypothetical protein
VKALKVCANVPMTQLEGVYPKMRIPHASRG